MSDLPQIHLTGAWDTLLAGNGRAIVEQQVLPQFLPRQRWFGAKTRNISRVRIVDHAVTSPGALLIIAQIDYDDADNDLYFLPLSVVSAGSVEPLARVTGPGGEAVLIDALTDPEVPQRLLAAIAEGRETPTQHGAIRAVATRDFATVRGDPAAPLPAKLGPATSSNSLVFFDQRLLLKLFRRLQPGINPDFEIGCFLTERAGFERTPKMAGALEYHRASGEVLTLAILQQYIPEAVDGWSHALDELKEFFQRAADESDHSDPWPVLGDKYLGMVRLLGQRTAEMHLALASDRNDPDFAPEPLTMADLAKVAEEVREHGAQALAMLRRRPVPALADETAKVLALAPSVLNQLGTGRAPAGVKTRCHGDYHLGQVLVAADDFVILDFEGEPTRPIADRRAKQSPLRDVAGMLRSLDYAAYVGLFAYAQGRAEEFHRLEAWAAEWQWWTAGQFLGQYLGAAAGASFIPADHDETRRLLDLFMLGKAFYELVYELNNRPDWVRIPLRGLLGLLQEERPGIAVPALSTRGPT
jgi:maltose alpha-D-glucosyltransferase / alpha-amylase